MTIHKTIRSQEILDKILESWTIDSENRLRWKRNASGGVKSGDLVGMSNVSGKHRRCVLYFDGKQHTFVESNVIMFLRTGNWEYGLIDHKDGNPLNNSESNLRVCTQSENMCNAALRSDNTTGAKGVYQRYGKWAVQIWKNKKAHNFGVYEDFELAQLVSIEARNKLHLDYARS